MSRLPSVPRLAADASFTEFVRRVAALHQLSELKATHALGLDQWPLGGPSAFDVIGFTREQADRLGSATGMNPDRIATLTFPASFPALNRVRMAGKQSDPYGRSWDSSGIHRTDAPACVLCLREDPHVFPLAWRLSLQPVCLQHAVYLAPTCERCGRFPGRPVRTRVNYEPYCRSACNRSEPQQADESVIAAQTRLRDLMTDTTPNDSVLRATLDFAWYLRHHLGKGARAKSNAPTPRELGRIVELASDWSTREPEYVATQPEFLAVPARTLQPKRPFASASLRTSFYSRARPQHSELPRRSPHPGVVRVEDPYYLPLDLHIKYTSDLVHDGWARKTPPTLRTSRLIAAQAVTSDSIHWTTTSAAAVTRRLEERGQLEQWLAALNAVRTELDQNPRLFGATWGDIDIFAANFRQDSEASYPVDAAIIWFLRDHRCVNYANRLGWSVQRRKSASATERHARRTGKCGPWELIEERFAHAAAVADRNYRPDAQTA